MKKEILSNKAMQRILYTGITFIILELIYRFSVDVHIHLSKIFFLIVYSILFGTIASLFKKDKFNNIVFAMINILITVIYLVQSIFYSAFNYFGMIERFSRTRELLAVADSVSEYLSLNIFVFIFPLIWIFIATYFLVKNKMENEKHVANRIMLFVVAILLFFSINSYYIYGNKDSNKRELSNTIQYAENYGIIDLLRKDIFNNIFLNKNVVDAVDLMIEFDVGQEENSMSSIYEDKNFIFITAESLGVYGINEQITPTLYRMQQESLNFTNYYSPKANTLKSEYSILTSFPLSAERENKSFSSINTMPTLFNDLGYNSLSFHDYKEGFYGRNTKNIELGFNAFFGNEKLGIPLSNADGRTDEDLFGVTFPKDRLLFEKSFPIYSNDEKFFSYLLTVSGHTPYKIDDRVPLRDNYEIINESFPEMTESIKTYYAGIMELDKGVEILLNDLESENLLDNTVIAIVGDHYPYGFSETDLKLISGNDISKFDLDQYKVPFLIWDNTKPAETIDTVMSNVDILPTISNMFNLGLKYSFGKDVFSSSKDQIIVEWQTEGAYSFLTQDGGKDFSKSITYGNMTDEEIEYQKNRSYQRSLWNNENFVLNGFRE